MSSELKLVYVDRVGFNSNGKTEYDFLFSNVPDDVWGEDWNETCPSACGNLYPSVNEIDMKRRVITDTEIHMAQENSCHSMQDMKDGIMACAWFLDMQLGEMKVMPYAMGYEDVEKMLNKSDISFEEFEGNE